MRKGPEQETQADEGQRDACQCRQQGGTWHVAAQPTGESGPRGLDDAAAQGRYQAGAPGLQRVARGQLDRQHHEEDVREHAGRVDAIGQGAHVVASLPPSQPHSLPRVEQVAGQDGQGRGGQDLAMDQVRRKAQDGPTEGIDDQQLHQVVDGKAEEAVDVSPHEPTGQPGGFGGRSHGVSHVGTGARSAQFEHASRSARRSHGADCPGRQRRAPPGPFGLDRRGPVGPARFGTRRGRGGHRPPGRAAKATCKAPSGRGRSDRHHRRRRRGLTATSRCHARPAAGTIPAAVSARTARAAHRLHGARNGASGWRPCRPRRSHRPGRSGIRRGDSGTRRPRYGSCPAAAPHPATGSEHGRAQHRHRPCSRARIGPGAGPGRGCSRWCRARRSGLGPPGECRYAAA